MPHIKVKHLPDFQFPIEYDGYIFHGIGKSKYKKRLLIDVEFDKQHFLLEIKKRTGDEILIKPDKVTRPASNVIVKGALATLIKVGDLEVTQSNIAINKKDHALQAIPYLKPVDYFEHNFPKNKEVWIEIGFGSGRHILYQAKKHPEVLFIGIEIHKPSIEQLLKQIVLQKIDNIFVVDYDARLFMEFVPSNSIGRIFIHFPVPWDKKPHRRVISKDFIQEVKRVLKKDGTLELRTDSENYFYYVYELLMQEKELKIDIRKNREGAIRSKYEDRWKRYGKDIYDLIYYALETSPPLQRECNFAFASLNWEPKRVVSLPKEPILFDNFFVHFQDVYEFDFQKYLLQVSFGNFNRPEHKYIWYTKNGIFYYNAHPVCSSFNQKAHNAIKEILDGKECYSC